MLCRRGPFLCSGWFKAPHTRRVARHHQRMQPELIGALLGAGAGIFVGGLALYGALRQAQAARRAADIAALAAEQAAETAAEATQQATERAARAAYDQWRYASRRDAAVAFALAADEAVSVAMDLEDGDNNATQEDEQVAFRAMLRALAVLEAEGPEPLFRRARSIVDSAAVLSEAALTVHLEVIAGNEERRPLGSPHNPDHAMLLNLLFRERREFREVLRGYLEDPEADLPELSTQSEWDRDPASWGPFAVVWS